MPASHDIDDDTGQLSSDIKAEAIRLGFDLIGIAPAVSPVTFPEFKQWLQNGFSGEMTYLDRRETAYEHPDHVLKNVKSLIVLAMNYRTSEPAERGPLDGRVARYAWGQGDYHDVLRERMKRLADFIHSRRDTCRTRGVVDTAPVLERDFARFAGLGWFGKNTMLINKRAGSWLFLCAILTDLELQYDDPHHTSHCGTCQRCLDVCPTDAFPEPYVLDARKCISYLTIEMRDKPIPLELRDGMGDWLFGCDLCQDVCPWNHKAPISNEPEFQPADQLSPADASSLLKLNDDEFDRQFGQTALARPSRRGLLRNAAIVLGNSQDVSARPALTAAIADHEPLVREASAWALGKIGGPAALTALKSRAMVEDNELVLDAINLAMDLLQGINS